MKLPNGYGGISKLSGNRRKPYMIRKTIGEDEEGRQIFSPPLGYYATKIEALEALVELNKKNIKDVQGLERQNITLGKLYKEWYEQQEYALEMGNISASSLEGYRTAWNHLERLQKDKVRYIKKKGIKEVIDSLHKEGYSKSALTKVKMLAGLLMDYAMEDDILDKNYAKLVKIPTIQQDEKDIFTAAEILKLTKDAKVNEWSQVILIMIYTGMRPGELFSLAKSNIDIIKMVIIGGAKTDAGKDRIIPIHSKIQPYFKSRYECAEHYLFEVPGKTLKNKVDNFRKNYFNPTLIRLKIREELTPYSCRHTFGSLMDGADANRVSIQQIIGHSDYATTANTYTHPDVEKLRKEIEKI